MKLRIFTFVFLFIFSGANAHAGIWDIFSAPYNYVADWFSGDDTEVATGSSVVADDPTLSVEKEDTPLIDDLTPSNLTLNTGSNLNTDFFNTGFRAPYLPSPLTLSPITSTSGAFYPSMYTTGNYSSPMLSYGLTSSPYSFGPSMPQTCSAFDYSLCVFCYSPSFSLIDDLYKNQCDELYSDVPDVRSDEDADAYCQCHEDKNKEMFAKPEVKDFIKEAVEKKKSEVAAEVIASFQNIAVGVGLAVSHPYFGRLYDGTLGSLPEAACKPNNFKNIIANLTKPNREGNAPCKQDSLKKMFDLAADQAEKCGEKKTLGWNGNSGSRPGYDSSKRYEERRKRFGTFKGSEKEKEFCETFGSLDGLKEKLKYVEPTDFDGIVSGFSEIFEGKVNGEISQMANAVEGRRDVGLLLGSISSRRHEIYEWRKENGFEFRPGFRKPASEETSAEDNDSRVSGYRPLHVYHDAETQIMNQMTTNVGDFSQTFDPNLYYTKIQELFSRPDSCEGDQCFDIVRVLSTEPYIMGPWMQQAKDEVPLSEDMLKLIQDHRVMQGSYGNKSGNHVVGLNVLTPEQKKALSDHSKKVLDKFKSKAFQFMKVQSEKELPRNIDELQNTKKELESRMATARRQGNVDVIANLQQQIDLTKETIDKMENLKGHLGNMTKDAGAFTLKNVEEAMSAMWGLQSNQLDQGCKAVQDQVELYCRLNEQPEMYSASDLLDLDFNNNKKIAAEFDKGKASSNGSTSKLAILDAMTCMEKGKFTSFPKNGDDLFFINGAGELDECHSKIKEDSFPKFQSDVFGGGGYSTMIAAKDTWEGWSRCEGKEFKTRTSDFGDSQNIKERVDNGQVKESPSFQDVGKITLGEIADSYKKTVSKNDSDAIASLNNFKSKYGDISSPSNYSDGFFEKISMKSDKGKLANNYKEEFIDEVVDEREIQVSGSGSRAPASEKNNNGNTVVQSNGTVQYNPLYSRNGEPVVSENLEKIDERLSKNNEQLVGADTVTKEIQARVDQAGPGGVDQSVLDQLEALRKQIEELKKDNEKLAVDRKIEIEKLKREELEASIAAASSGNNGSNKPVVEERTASFSTAPVAKVTTTSGNGSNGVVGGTSSGGAVIGSNSGFVENTANVVPSGSTGGTVVQGKNGKASSNRGVFLTGTTSGGEQFNISSGDVLNFEGRSDVTSFDSAVAIALQSSKNAFVFDGKFYVKKGESYIEVKNIKEKERAVASEEEVKDIKDVSALLDRLKKEDEEKVEELSEKVVPVVETTDKAQASDADDRKKVKSLWRIIIDNINPFK